MFRFFSHFYTVITGRERQLCEATRLALEIVLNVPYFKRLLRFTWDIWRFEITIQSLEVLQ